jgi:V/A-type H+-transporting ATPase subunit E
LSDIEEKKDKFSIAINHYAEEQRQKIENDISSFKQKELEETEIEVLTECYRMIQKEMAQMRSGISHEMAERAMDVRRKLLEKRQKITNEVFNRASDNLKEYTKKESYEVFLKKSSKEFANVFNDSETIFYIKPGDEKYKELIKETFGQKCTFKTNSEILIGGIRAYNADMGVIADHTLDTLLADQLEWFEEYSGMTVV